MMDGTSQMTAVSQDGKTEMTAAPKEGKIYSALAALLTDCEYVAKDKENKEQGYKFRSIYGFIDMLHPLQARHKIFVMPRVIKTEREERKSKRGGMLLFTILTVMFTFYTDDGSSVSAVVVGEGMDSGDKSANKAMSAALKYAWMQVLSIPSSEEGEAFDDERMIDSEDNRNDVAPKGGDEASDGGEDEPLQVQKPKAGKAPDEIKKMKIPNAEALKDRQEYPREELVKYYNGAKRDENKAGMKRIQAEGERRLREDEKYAKAFDEKEEE